LKKAKKIAFALLVIFALLQLYQPARNEDYGQVSAIHIERMVPMDDTVRTILRESCYDCHSNNTRYPWYANVQPVRAFLETHIKEGKEKLNFSEFGDYTVRRQQSKLRSIGEQVETSQMPLASYTWIHGSAKLSQSERAVVDRWVEASLERY